MNESIPKNTPELPSMTPEKAEEYISNANQGIQLSLDIGIRGYEVDTDTYEPWPISELQRSCNSIITFLEQREKLYMRAGESEKALEGKRVADEAKIFFC